MTETLTKVNIKGREILLIGTAHISKESVEEVRRVITEERPGRVCVEIDAGRYQSMKQGSSWHKLDIRQVLKEKKGFLLLANLVVSSFQRKMGANLGIKPGEEMKEAINVCDELGIPYDFSDREVQVTLRRAWGKSNFWNKNKLLASLTASIFSSEKVSEDEIEKMKKNTALDSMMDELANYLPSVKEVLIDERDQYLATKIFSTKEEKVVAVVGAGHVPGIVRWLEALQKGEKEADLSEISQLPKPGMLAKIMPFVLPVLVLAIIGAGFALSGKEVAFDMVKTWVLWNGSLSAIGALLVAAHPLTIILSFLAAPITSMNPMVGVGMFTGALEALLRKPRVADFENLHDDILSVKGFYKNRVTHILLVFFASSIGSAIATWLSVALMTGNLKLPFFG